MSIHYDEMTVQDYPNVIDLWRNTEGGGLSSADTLETISSYLTRNPAHSFVARDNTQLGGAVLCGHDGRRGYLYHLAVQPSYRRQGIGQALVARCMQSLQAVGIDKCHIFVYSTNQTGQAFWEKIGWVLRTNLVLMSRELP